MKTYDELLEISQKHDKLSQFNQFFDKRFEDYLPSSYIIDDNLRKDLEIVINVQKKAHFFVHCISTNKNIIKMEFSLYKQLLEVSQEKFDDTNDKLNKLNENLEKCHDFFINNTNGNKNNINLFKIFMLRLNNLLILYKICQSIGNGLDLIKDSLNDDDTVKECLRLYVIVNKIFTDSIMKSRNDIIKTYNSNQQDIIKDTEWNLIDNNQKNQLLPNKEQISQILMHLMSVNITPSVNL